MNKTVFTDLSAHELRDLIRESVREELQVQTPTEEHTSNELLIIEKQRKINQISSTTDEVVQPTDSRAKRKILFLTANPIIINSENKQTPLLRVAEECRKVKDCLEAATNRKDFGFISEPAVRITTITKAMQVHNPQIVHFSGHGTKTRGIAIEDESGQVTLFPTEGLNRLFKLFKGIVKCVVLNACHSSAQAEVISKHGIYVIGMNDAIGDEAATSFAVGFYQSLGERKDYEFAFGIGMVNASSHLKHADKPELWFNGERINN